MSKSYDMFATLTYAEVQTTINALRIAAEKYRDNAALFRREAPADGTVYCRLALQFENQGDDADRLRHSLEDLDSED